MCIETGCEKIVCTMQVQGCLVLRRASAQRRVCVAWCSSPLKRKSGAGAEAIQEQEASSRTCTPILLFRSRNGSASCCRFQGTGRAGLDALSRARAGTWNWTSGNQVYTLSCGVTLHGLPRAESSMECGRTQHWLGWRGRQALGLTTLFNFLVSLPVCSLRHGCAGGALPKLFQSLDCEVERFHRVMCKFDCGEHDVFCFSHPRRLLKCLILIIVGHSNFTVTRQDGGRTIRCFD